MECKPWFAHSHSNAHSQMQIKICTPEQMECKPWFAHSFKCTFSNANQDLHSRTHSRTLTPEHSNERSRGVAADSPVSL